MRAPARQSGSLAAPVTKRSRDPRQRPRRWLTSLAAVSVTVAVTLAGKARPPSFTEVDDTPGVIFG